MVSKRQQGNPVLKHIRNVRWVFGDIGPDYLLGANACALFLSLRCRRELDGVNEAVKGWCDAGGVLQN